MQIFEDAAGLRASRNPFGAACSVAVPCWLERAGALCTAASCLGKSAAGEGSAAFAPSSVTSSPSGRAAALPHRVLLPLGDVLAHHSFEARPVGNAERSGAAHILLNTRLPQRSTPAAAIAS